MIKHLDSTIWIAVTRKKIHPKCKICGWINLTGGHTDHTEKVHYLIQRGIDRKTAQATWIQKQRVLR